MSGNSNLGAKDIVNALQFLKKVSASFGGNQDITLAGQSSGGTLIRALLAAPSAEPLFKQAWLHSDPIAYGFNMPSAQTNLQNAFYGNLSCAATDLSCQQSAPLDDILNVQWQIYNACATIDPSTTGDQPIRVVHDDQFITTTLTGTSFPGTLKPLVLTTTNKDAGPAIYGNIPVPLPAAVWSQALSVTFSPEDIEVIDNSGYYPVPEDDIRPQMVNLGTDQIWRCPAWTLARTWASRGGTVYTGEFEVGSVYADSSSLTFCTSTNVCHEGDIEVVFGTISSPSPSQNAIIRETQTRYSSFTRTSDPNAPGFSNWSKVSSKLVALQLGGSGYVSTGACDVGFFGEEVKYIYQTFNQ